MACYLCDNPTMEPIPGEIRDRGDLGLLQCPRCRLVVLSDFSHIAEGFYQSDYTKLNHGDKGWAEILAKGAADTSERAASLRSLVTGRSYLDVGCGAGGLLLELSSLCQTVEGVEPQEIWRKKLNGAGITVYPSLDAIAGKKFDVITVFHVLEHVADPVPFLLKVITLLEPNGKLILEVPNVDDALISVYHSQAFRDFTFWSAHLFYYSAETLSRLILKAGINNSLFVVRQHQRYPLSNHLYWLTEGKPGGQRDYAFLNSSHLNDAYAAQLAAIGGCDSLRAHISI